METPHVKSRQERETRRKSGSTGKRRSCDGLCESYDWPARTGKAAAARRTSTRMQLPSSVSTLRTATHGQLNASSISGSSTCDQPVMSVLPVLNMGDCALPFLPLFIRTSSGFTNWQTKYWYPYLLRRTRLDSKGECETCEFALRAHKAHIVRQISHYASVSVPYTTVILIHTAHRQGPLAPVGSACGH